MNTESHPLGEAEGAFLPCTFWLAAALAMLGENDRAEAILERVEAASGELGLFAEEMGPKTGAFLGNTPLLFSHAEYIKAVLAIAKSRPLGKLGLMARRSCSCATASPASDRADQERGENTCRS